MSISDRKEHNMVRKTSNTEGTAAPVAPAVKKPRKKPVRRLPALKDFPNRLAWLKAMTEYEESQATVSAEARIIRLNKRIVAKEAAISKLRDEIDVLDAELAELDPPDPLILSDQDEDEVDDEPEPEPAAPQS